MKSKFIHFIGIDVSKSKFDACAIINQEKSEIFHAFFEQSKNGFKEFKKWLRQLVGKETDKVLICVENTGLYDDALLYFLSENQLPVCLENAANIRRSIRDLRAKNDKLDSQNIAIYALRHNEDLVLWQRPRKVIEQLKQLVTNRSRLVNALKMLKQAQKEEKGFNWAGITHIKPYEAGIKGLQKDIEQIEKDIWDLIKTDKELFRMVLLITSIPSVGKITAYHFICFTNEFKTVKSGKQLASYCGVVPFEQTSGKCKKSKPRVSHKANKILKTLLYLCAITAIKMKGDFAAYYRKKVEQGKEKLIAINGIKNKLALTIAAVIRNKEPYNENYIYQH